MQIMLFNQAHSSSAKVQQLFFNVVVCLLLPVVVAAEWVVVARQWGPEHHLVRGLSVSADCPPNLSDFSTQLSAADSITY